MFVLKQKGNCPSKTTYAAVGVQSSKDYWNANVNDSGGRQSFSQRQNMCLDIWLQREQKKLAPKSN